jgi:hypothetical protein
MFRRASIPLPIAGFGLDLLEAEARGGLPLADLVARAAARYAAADRSRPSHRVPRFLRQAEPRVGSSTVDVELSPDLWHALEELADEQGTTLELTVLHAAMLYAAERSASPPRR